MVSVSAFCFFCLCECVVEATLPQDVRRRRDSSRLRHNSQNTSQFRLSAIRNIVEWLSLCTLGRVKIDLQVYFLHHLHERVSHLFSTAQLKRIRYYIRLVFGVVRAVLSILEVRLFIEFKL